MADKAHRLTDEKLEEMEKRPSAIYSRAEKEIGERWKEYLAESQAEIDELQKSMSLQKGRRYTLLKIDKASSRHKRNAVSLHSCKERRQGQWQKQRAVSRLAMPAKLG